MEANQKVQNRFFSHLIFYSDRIFNDKKSVGSRNGVIVFFTQNYIHWEKRYLQRGSK